jgi:transposase
MNYSNFIGIDISKAKIDITTLNTDGELNHSVCTNSAKSIIGHLKSLKRNGFDIENSLVCAEFTGLYIFSLVEACKAMAIDLWIENAAQIKHRSGISRNKNDRIDSEKIAIYASRFKDLVKLYNRDDEVIEELKFLLNERDLILTDKTKYTAQIKDQKGHVPDSFYKNKVKRYKAIIKTLVLQLKSIQNQIDQLISGDDNLKHQFNLSTSITGIGTQAAIQTIVATRGFKDFSDPRKFACHAGVAPFQFMSGSSLKTKARVSQRANKKLKRVFHMAALSAVQVDGELRDYYNRKVEEGKNKMLVLNAVRSKLIHRLFAVIRNNQKYDKNYLNSLALSIR